MAIGVEESAGVTVRLRGAWAGKRYKQRMVTKGLTVNENNGKKTK